MKERRKAVVGRMHGLNWQMLISFLIAWRLVVVVAVGFSGDKEGG